MRTIVTLLLAAALGPVMVMAKETGRDHSRQCHLKLLAGGEPSVVRKYHDLTQADAQIREFIRRLMRQIPDSPRSSVVHAEIFHRARALRKMVAQLAFGREKFSDEGFNPVFEQVAADRLGAIERELIYLEVDFNDWRVLGNAGLADLLAHGRTDFLSDGVSYGVPGPADRAISRIQFAKAIAKRLFAKKAGLNKLSDELLIKILRHEYRRDGQVVCYRVRSFEFCGGLKGNTLFLNQQVSLRPDAK